MDQRVRQAFVYAELYLDNQIKKFEQEGIPEAVEHYKNELDKIKTDFDEVVLESIIKS